MKVIITTSCVRGLRARTPWPVGIQSSIQATGIGADFWLPVSVSGRMHYETTSNSEILQQIANTRQATASKDKQIKAPRERKQTRSSRVEIYKAAGGLDNHVAKNLARALHIFKTTPISRNRFHILLDLSTPCVCQEQHAPSAKSNGEYCKYCKRSYHALGPRSYH